MAQKTVTAVGDAQLDTAQKKFGTASGLFDGTGDYLTVPDNADFNFGTGNFTIDFWVRFSSIPGHVVFYEQVDAGDDFFRIYFNGTDKLYVAYIDDSTWKINFNVPFNPSTDTWYHIEVVKGGTTEATWHAFIDGTDGSKTVDTGTFDETIKDFTEVVRMGSQAGTGGYLNGWFDEFRISKGVARHTSNFTAPTVAYTTDDDTKLLLHMDGTDGSTTFTDSSPTPAGPANLKSINGLAKASIKSRNGLAIASIKSINGLA